MDRIFVKPKDGLPVRHPDVRRHLDAAGEWVQASSYWLRRIADKDVEETMPPSEPAAEPEDYGAEVPDATNATAQE